MIAPISLILKPTPCHRLERASAALGIDLWIKRDDLTGFAMGGNKGRKLEYLMAEAIAEGADVVVACGSRESNFIRQLGAACAVAGLACVAVVMNQPHEPGYAVPTAPRIGVGNDRLNEIFGVEFEEIPDGPWDDLFEAARLRARHERDAGQRVYEIPIGGSSPLGAYAFFEAADELPICDRVVTATSSGSTHIGLHMAFRDFPTQVTGIACDPEPALLDDLIAVANGLSDLLDQPKVAPDDIDLRREFVGPGYGVPSESGNAAIEWLARTEGILLDPIYSGKAFSGLMEMARSGELAGETVVFWHTGGLPSLFAFR